MSGLPVGTVTFLFSDVEGSTRLLRELGHDAYGRALADYQALVRGACADHDGNEIDTQGDAFFFAFVRARDAVAGAVQAQRALADHSWPNGASLRARIGLHTGSASLADGRYVGLSVHRTSRVCAAAAGGQVLLSETTAAVLDDEEHHLALRPVGHYRLKDFDRPVRLHQADVPGLPTKFRAPKAERRVDRRRLYALIAAALAVALAVTLGMLVASGDSNPSLSSTATGVIDPATGRLIDATELHAKAPLIAAGEGHVWLADPDTSTLFKLDPRTRSVVWRRAIEAGAIPTGIASGGGAVWLGVNRGRSLAVLALGTELGELRQSIELDRSVVPFGGSEAVRLAAGEGAIWVLEAGLGRLSRIDRSSPGRSVMIEGGTGAKSLAVGLGAVWLGGLAGVSRVDPETGAILGTTPVADLGDSETTSLAVGDRAVWYAGRDRPRLLKIGPLGNAVADTFDVGRGPVGVAVGDGHVWIANSLDRTVSRVDPDTGEVETIELGAPPGGVVAAFGAVWTSPGE